MAELDSGPCTVWQPLCPFVPEDATPEQQEIATQALWSATEALWHRTRRRFGLCEMTIRPCREECWPSWSWYPPLWHNVGNWGWPFPALVGGKWINLACGSCGSNCSCSRVSEVRLPYPVARIEQVKVDGQVLDPSAYRVDNHRLLVRLDGEDWPRCNNLNLDDDQDGTWSVAASYGEPVPVLGQRAVGELAEQIYKACIGDGSCMLPGQTVQRVQRQGVTKVFFDAEGAFSGGMIGLYSADLFIKTYNPTGSGPASIYDIDGPGHRQTGT